MAGKEEELDLEESGVNLGQGTLGGAQHKDGAGKLRANLTPESSAGLSSGVLHVKRLTCSYRRSWFLRWYWSREATGAVR